MVDKNNNQVVAEQFVNVTGATLVIDGVEYLPMAGQPVPNKWGGFSSYPLKFWDLLKKIQNDEGKFIPIKDKRGFHQLDEEIVPREDGTVYIVTSEQAKLFESARRHDFVIFQADNEINWREIDRERKPHTFEGKTVKVVYVRKEFIQELILKDTEELPTIDDIAAAQEEFASQQQQEEISNGLGNPFQELDSSQFAQEEAAIEEVEPPKKKATRKKTSKKVEVAE